MDVYVTCYPCVLLGRAKIPRTVESTSQVTMLVIHDKKELTAILIKERV
jgi:hypothetical protein